MLNVIKPYVFEADIEPSIVKRGLSSEAAGTYRQLCMLKHRQKVDLSLYPKADIKELEEKKLVCLTQSLDTLLYVLLVGTVAMPVGMLKVRVVGGTGALKSKGFNAKRKVR